MLLDAAVSEGSSANTKALDAWVTERLKERANIQKQTRSVKRPAWLQKERVILAEGGETGGGWPKRRPNSKEKAGASGAAETEGKSRCERGSR